MTAPTPESQASIDRFIDAVWIEEGLSQNTLAAYRRDLTLFAAWLAGHNGKSLDAAPRPICCAYAVHRSSTKATSSQPRLAVLRRYFRWALREHLVQADPTLRCSAPGSRCACRRP
jgi:integrase/recombinase XerD